jgi:hypothetical protein
VLDAVELAREGAPFSKGKGESAIRAAIKRRRVTPRQQGLIERRVLESQPGHCG